MRFAVCQWDVEPRAETAEALAAGGVTAVELGATFLTRHGEAETEALGGWCRAAGIQVYVCHAPFGEANDLSLLDEGARRQALSVVQESLAHAALVGAECAVIHPSTGSFLRRGRGGWHGRNAHHRLQERIGKPSNELYLAGRVTGIRS